ncbi:hypothetical protein [uncultured Piscinibacter sp.]|uniref:hypothetical protein n=1 Tax=uncultured Piscinibacter sp. TaxID=1131835 RepID=UPI002601E2F7|nr:hypothetical protein [uncultured Piscinibacter sp.]
MSEDQHSAGDALPSGCELIEVHVTALRQLFNAIDASPFRERDLDPGADEFIVGWAREASHGAPLALLVSLDRDPGPADEPAALRDTIHAHFSHRARITRSRLRQLLGIGRISLLLGLGFLAIAVGLGDLVASAMKGRQVGELLRQGLVICGWVAMWRPLEIFLYGWWPIRAEARLYDRLSAMPVRILYRGTDQPDAWRHDWPVVLPTQVIPQKSPPHAASAERMAEPAVDSSVPERQPIGSVAYDTCSPSRRPGGSRAQR